MKKYSLTILLIILSVLAVSAQKKGDLLYLKNGSVINGTLTETTTDYYKIRTADGSLFVYPVAEVEKVELNTANHRDESEDDTNLGFSLEAGFLAGVQSSEYVAPFSFNMLINFSLTEKQSIGIGSGVEFLGVSYTPVFGEFRFLLKDNSTSPFGFVRAGYMMFTGTDNSDDYYGSEREHKGGPSLSIGGGINWDKGSHDMYLSFAYRYIRTEYSYEDYYSSLTTYKTNWNRLEIKFGFRF